MVALGSSKEYLNPLFHKIRTIGRVPIHLFAEKLPAAAKFNT